MQYTAFQDFVTDTGMINNRKITAGTLKMVWNQLLNYDGQAGDTNRPYMIWWEFVEAIGSLAVFHSKNPYVPIERKVKDFITNVILTSETIKEKRLHFLTLFGSRFKPG